MRFLSSCGWTFKVVDRKIYTFTISPFIQGKVYRLIKQGRHGEAWQLLKKCDEVIA
jgi:hypothetical protein